MPNIRQTSLYASFMKKIGWQVEKIDDVFAYIKKLPILPAVIKIQRPQKLPEIEKLRQLMIKYHTRSITIEPLSNYELRAKNYKLIKDPYLPTKTIYIDLTRDEVTMFNRFSEAKRRAVRRAQNLGVEVEISDNIDAFIKLKNLTTGLFFGFLTTKTIKPLWQTFAPDYAQVLLAFHPQSRQSKINLSSPTRVKTDKKIVAGILLLYINTVAYYWMAAATQAGKKHFASTLLVWEAIKLAKDKGCKVFDFEGIYDERYSSLNKNWLGFTKFKQGFGGKEVYYPQPFMIR